MIEKNDWRLTGQEKYLKGKKLIFAKWHPRNDRNDHDHCEFCWAKFGDFPDALHEGYTTEDMYPWVCPECYEDFKMDFEW